MVPIASLPCWLVPLPPNSWWFAEGRTAEAGVLAPELGCAHVWFVSWRLGLAATNGHSLEALIQHGLQNVDILILSFHLHLLAGIPWKEKIPHNYESCLATLDCKLFRKCRGYAWFFSLYLIAFKIMRWFSWSCKGDHSVFIFQLCVHKLTHFYLFLLQLLFFLLLNFGQ